MPNCRRSFSDPTVFPLPQVFRMYGIGIHDIPYEAAPVWNASSTFFHIYSLGLKFFSADSAFHKASSPPVSGPRCLGNTIFILHIKKHAKKDSIFLCCLTGSQFITRPTYPVFNLIMAGQRNTKCVLLQFEYPPPPYGVVLCFSCFL